MEIEGTIIKLTSAEISQVWAAYMNDSAAVCQLTYFSAKAQDTEVKPVIEHALKLAQSHIATLTEIMNKENFPIPYGFKIEEDVDINAPRLFSDTYVLYYLQHMGKIGLNAYSLGISYATRADMYSYFNECHKETTELLRQANEVLLAKGLYIRPPFIHIQKGIDFVEKQNFLSGYINKRPLSALEITNLFANYQRNALGIATQVGYSQVAKSQDVKQFFVRGRDLARKHCDTFGKKLKEDYLPVPASWDAEVTDSAVYTFSDKLMMFFTSAMTAISIGFYGSSVSSSPRRDLGTMYTQVGRDVLLYAEDGANIMINNGWLEEPPKTLDREELVKLGKQV